MVQWKCNQCNYILKADKPPETCPSCKQECAFIDVTCYTPDCGGPDSGNVDPQLVGGRKPER